MAAYKSRLYQRQHPKMTFFKKVNEYRCTRNRSKNDSGNFAQYFKNKHHTERISVLCGSFKHAGREAPNQLNAVLGSN